MPRGVLDNGIVGNKEGGTARLESVAELASDLPPNTVRPRLLRVNRYRENSSSPAPKWHCIQRLTTRNVESIAGGRIFGASGAISRVHSLARTKACGYVASHQVPPAPYKIQIIISPECGDQEKSPIVVVRFRKILSLGIDRLPRQASKFNWERLHRFMMNLTLWLRVAGAHLRRSDCRIRPDLDAK
jgi:hypothetical protein